MFPGSCQLSVPGTPGPQIAKGELQYSGYQCLSTTVTFLPLDPSGPWHHTSEDTLPVSSLCSHRPIPKTISTMEKSVQPDPTPSLLGRDCRLLLGRESTLRLGPAPYKKSRLHPALSCPSCVGLGGKNHPGVPGPDQAWRVSSLCPSLPFPCLG